MSMKNYNDNIANRTRELSAFDHFTSPPYFRFYTAFWGSGSGRSLQTFRNIFWKLGEIQVKKRNFAFLYKRESVFF